MVKKGKKLTVLSWQTRADLGKTDSGWEERIKLWWQHQDSYHSLDHGCKGGLGVVGGFGVGRATPWWSDHYFNGAAPTNPPPPTPSLSPEASNTNGASDDNQPSPNFDWKADHQKSNANLPNYVLRHGKKFKVVISQYFMSRLLIHPHYPLKFNPIISLIPSPPRMSVQHAAVPLTVVIFKPSFCS